MVHYLYTVQNVADCQFLYSKESGTLCISTQYRAWQIVHFYTVNCSPLFKTDLNVITIKEAKYFLSFIIFRSLKFSSAIDSVNKIIFTFNILYVCFVSNISHSCTDAVLSIHTSARCNVTYKVLTSFTVKNF